MATKQAQAGREQVDLSESSVWGNAGEDASEASNATAGGEAALDRLESITGGADDPVIAEGELGKQFDQLDAATDEEVDALKVNLLQDEELDSARDGSGHIVDDLAEERIGKLTETGPFEEGQGTVSVSPGRDDTSATLRRHYSNTEAARSEDIAEDNLDEPKNG
jgi:hypothetical protein